MGPLDRKGLPGAGGIQKRQDGPSVGPWGSDTSDRWEDGLMEPFKFLQL